MLAATALDDEGLSFDHPHFSTATTTSGDARAATADRLALRRSARRAAAASHRALRLRRRGRARAGSASVSRCARRRKASAGWRYEIVVRRLRSARRASSSSIEERSTSRSDSRLASRADRCEPARSGTRLPFMPASAVRPGMVMVTDDGRASTSSKASSASSSTDRSTTSTSSGTHNFVADGLVTHNSVYGFRGADIRNIPSSSRTSPERTSSRSSRTTARRTRSCEPPTRSSSTTRERKPKHLFSDLGEGEPVRVVELEDEHSEARFVAAEIARADRPGALRERDRGLLPDERAVASARGRARAPGRRRTRSSAGRGSTSGRRSGTRPRT